MTDLDKAREWANKVYAQSPEYQATVKIIKSLPDQLVDAEKVREIIEEMDLCLEAKSTTDFSKGIDNATTNWRDALKALITPKLPTLADMTQEERKACQWMQCKVETGDGDTIGVICQVWSKRVHIIFQSGRILDVEHRRVTPLPDLPKLEWPGGVVDAEIADEPETTCSGSIHTPMQPSEVPPNEPWLIEVDTQKAIGTRYQGDAVTPWAIAALNGSFSGDYMDSEVTLIHKLVPESPALPEGMRLADHEEYGRVVVSPRTDDDGDYKIFRSTHDCTTGSGWGFAHESKLTFLDGKHAGEVN